VQQINQSGAQSGTGGLTGAAPGTYNKAFVAILLNQQVKFELIRQHLVANRALPGPDVLKTARTEIAQQFGQGIFDAFPRRYQQTLISQQAQADAFIALSSKAPGADDAIRQYYEAHQNDYATEACVRHILVADKDPAGQIDFTASLTTANKLKADIAGGADFAVVAKASSQDNQGPTGGSAAQGGQLTGSATDGCLTTSDLQQLIAEFSAAVLALPLHLVSDPVKTQFGYHLIEVTSRTIEPLDDTVTNDIRQRTASDQLNQLVSQAKIKVSPEFGTFDNKLDKTTGLIPGVVPPLVPPVGSSTTAASAQASPGG
jgi:parvulin-like peptidyl-prolyl isomerase